ncbi:DUF2484 family protein [Loktanella sp. R86503]|uniref:DUF2484 family protein n=1 Tax=Loktanella sp. R86503 TaxID=3093847 RepID=UPI0036DE5573
MSAPVLMALIWLIAANVAALFPSRDHHWRLAYGMIAVGIPLLGWVTWQQGPIVGLLFLAAGASVLRWPVIYLTRWLRGTKGPKSS